MYLHQVSFFTRTKEIRNTDETFLKCSSTVRRSPFDQNRSTNKKVSIEINNRGNASVVVLVVDLLLLITYIISISFKKNNRGSKCL